MNLLLEYIKSVINEETPQERKARLKQKFGQARTVRMGSDSGPMAPGLPQAGRPAIGLTPTQPTSLDSELAKRGISKDAFNMAQKLYTKKGITKSPEELMDELTQIYSMQRSNLPGMQQMKRFGQQQVGKQLVRPGQVSAQPKRPMSLDRLKARREALEMKQQRIQECVNRAILKHQKKQAINQFVNETLQEQIDVRDRINYLLTENPLGNIWQGIKGAVQGAGMGRRGTDKSAFAGAMDGFAQGKAQSQAASALSKAMKKVSSEKQKFNSNILKNVENVNRYHDAVLNAFQVFKQVQPALGPHADKMGQEIGQMLGQLQYDLESEQEQLDNFLTSLKQVAPEAEKTAKDVRKQTAVDPSMGSGKTKVAQPGDEGYVQFPGRRGGTGEPTGHPAQRPSTQGEYDQYLKTKGVDVDSIKQGNWGAYQKGLKKYQSGMKKLESANPKKKKK